MQQPEMSLLNQCKLGVLQTQQKLEFLVQMYCNYLEIIKKEKQKMISLCKLLKKLKLIY